MTRAVTPEPLVSQQPQQLSSASSRNTTSTTTTSSRPQQQQQQEQQQRRAPRTSISSEQEEPFSTMDMVNQKLTQVRTKLDRYHALNEFEVSKNCFKEIIMLLAARGWCLIVSLGSFVVVLLLPASQPAPRPATTAAAARIWSFVCVVVSLE